MLALLAPIFVFGLVIFVHELGHFIAAKSLGVYAPRFSIGFGPPIFKFRRGETEYILAWLPFGGYVRMASRHDAEASFLEGGNEEEGARKESDPEYDPDAMIPFGPKPVPEHRWFESKPLWARIIIMLAGVTMNTLLAIVVATGLGRIVGQDIIPSTVVGPVATLSSAPELAQLHLGDTLKAVNGRAVSTWNDVQHSMALSGDHVTFTTQHGDVRVPLHTPPEHPNVEDMLDAVGFRLPPIIDSVFAGDPAAKAGLQPGDSVVSVDGKAIAGWSEMVASVDPAADRTLTFVVARKGALVTLPVTPKRVELTDSAAKTTRVVGRIGAAARTPIVHTSMTLAEAARFGLRETVAGAGEIFTFLHQLGAGTQSVRQLAGPVAITRAAVQAGQAGFTAVLRLVILLSINLAVLNLLPIPILDGGQIVINVLESAKGSPFSLRTREYILRFGLAAIALIFAIVMYNDTRDWFVRLFGWAGRLFGA